jgi:membrane-associated phospholipid phosphatase
VTGPGRHAATRGPATGDVRLVAAPVAWLLALTFMVVLSGLVSAGRTSGFDDSAGAWFWPSGEWEWPQLVCDVVVEGLQPRVSVLLLLVGGALAARRHRSLWPLLLAGGAVVLLAAGLLVLRSAVTRVDMHGVGGSYPSGHEASIVVTAGTLVLVAQWHRARWWTVTCVSAPPAVVMGTALLVTGTHWFTDVVGGALLGLLVLTLVAVAAGRYGRA